jgi:arylsulfatase A-like enzyme
MILRFLLSLEVLSLAVVAHAAPVKPNIILIYTDDHGYADLGIHGVKNDLKTPHLDALARSGVVARNGYSTAPQCVPSRGGLLTGKFQGRFALDSNASALDGFNRETTIATRLQQSGYVTAQFGKWHLGPTTEIPTHGFRHVFSQNTQRPFSANITLDGQDIAMSELPATSYHIDGCSQAAAAIIKRIRDAPFFLYLAYRAPHTPLDAPQSYKDRFPGEMPERRRAALGMLAAIDDGVGLITETLKKWGLTEKTLIFFIGDNGAPLKIHKIDSPLQGDPGGWDGSLNDPLNGEKGMLAEGGMHVPFLIAWPGTIPGGQIYEYPVSALDVAATAAALAGIVTQAGDLDGVNLIPHLTGENSAPPHDALYWRWTAQSAIREGNWKLLRGGEREYLYDLSTDPGEKWNLAGQHPEVTVRLRGKLTDWAGKLNPPGLALAPMAPVWNDYFDHYLEGKTKSLDPPAGKGVKPEWEARNGTLTLAEGVLTLTPQGAGQKGRTFLTKANLNLKSPVTIKFEVNAASAGEGSISWRARGDKDFLPANRKIFTLTSPGEWQNVEIRLPAPSDVIHVRIQPTGGVSMFRSISFTN